MLEDVALPCPVCGKDLQVKVFRQKRDTYIVTDDCPNCKTKASKIEKMFNYRGTRVQTEKSYLKSDPRG
jgi:ssDNA-binding Zn-finger/Zn-ribbon topoisomerase 1